CPNFSAYYAGGAYGNVGSENVLYTGYGMNLDPLYGQTPTTGTPTGTFEGTHDRNWDPPPANVNRRWFKQRQYTKPTDRVLIADSKMWSLDARPAPTTG